MYVHCRINDAAPNPRFSNIPVKTDDVDTTVRKGRGISSNASLCGNFFFCNSVQMRSGKFVTHFERESKCSRITSLW
jgi:hypothetical protein